ncbi:MAG: dihydropteroate synthase [Aureispira sp.]|nr:dihydropteroate synthase [Aureispira sp.]
MTLNCNGILLDLNTPKIMGILNVTPDSFYDGGKWHSDKLLLQQVEAMLEDGASIIDIGGVSSKPGAQEVSLQEELKRVVPVVGTIAKQFPEALISIDTFRAEVAQQGIEAGGHIINDISAGTLDKKLIETVAELRVPYILMHMQGIPKNMQNNPSYSNVLLNIFDFFIERVRFLQQAGIKDVVLDVGFGFGKTLEHNYTLLKHLSTFHLLNIPILAGISRKSMIWKALKSSPDKALNGTTALHMVALQQGAKILRVHDVKEAVEVIQLHSMLEMQ